MYVTVWWNSTQKVSKLSAPDKDQQDDYTVEIPDEADDRCSSPWNKCKTYSDTEFDFSFVEKVQQFSRDLSKSIFTASRGHFYIAEVTIILPANWEPPPSNSEVKKRLNYNGTISSINFDQVPIRIYPDKVNMKKCEYL